jgi:hypothetical protein
MDQAVRAVILMEVCRMLLAVDMMLFLDGGVY